MMALKKNSVLRPSVILGISLMAALILGGSSVALHLPLATTAHAAPLRLSCAMVHGAQPALCEQQDPIVQGCVTDAETLDLHTVFQDTRQTKPLGEVELRYSPTCNSYWIRTTAFVTTAGVFKDIHAMLTFHNQAKEDIVGNHPTPTMLTPYVAWTDMTVAPMLPHAGSGSFDLFAQPAPITVTL